jgi:hypothetical protein
MQEVRRFTPSTVSDRMAVVTGFHRICMIDGIVVYSPADHVRRPVIPAESPTPALSHLQFEALLTAARESSNVFNFALVTRLGFLGLRIFEAYRAGIADISKGSDKSGFCCFYSVCGVGKWLSRDASDGAQVLWMRRRTIRMHDVSHRIRWASSTMRPAQPSESAMHTPSSV